MSDPGLGGRGRDRIGGFAGLVAVTVVVVVVVAVIVTVVMVVVVVVVVVVAVAANPNPTTVPIPITVTDTVTGSDTVTDSPGRRASSPDKRGILRRLFGGRGRNTVLDRACFRGPCFADVLRQSSRPRLKR